MQHLEGSATPVLYVGRTVLKGQTPQTEPVYIVHCTLWRQHVQKHYGHLQTN